MSLVQKSSRPKRAKRRSKAGSKIGGGAWRAFVHANASGKKMDATALKLEYDSLSPEDRAVYQAAGQAATAAHRMGLEPFSKKRAVAAPVVASNKAVLCDEVQPGTQTGEAAIVALDKEQRMQLLPFTGTVHSRSLQRFLSRE